MGFELTGRGGLKLKLDEVVDCFSDAVKLLVVNVPLFVNIPKVSLSKGVSK